MNNKLAFVYPPNKYLSLKHRQANQIFRKLRQKQINQERCECCGKYVGQESDVGCICYDPYFQLQFLGVSVPLLFSFMRNISILLIIFLVIVVFNAFLSNILSNSCTKEKIKCSNDLTTKFSISNKLLDADSVSIQIYLIFLMTGVWVIINQYIIYRLRKTQFQSDFYIQSPSDYAILLCQLPEQTNKFDIEALVRKRSQELRKQDRQATNDLKILEIMLPTKLDDYHQKQLQQQKKFLQHVRRHQDHMFERQPIKFSNQIAKVALVIFQKQKSKEFFLQKSTLSTEIKNLFCNCGVQMSEFLIRKQNIIIQRAPEPDDIIWANLGKSPKIIALRKLMTNFIGIALLCANGAIQYLLSLWQINQSLDNQKYISVFSSIIVNFMNYLITIFFIWSTKKQGNLTSTTENQSLTIKIVYFQFINSGIFYVFSNSIAVGFDTVKLQEIFSKKVTSFMLINAFSYPILSFVVDYFELTSWFDRMMFEKQLTYYTQRDCNQLYELPDSQIPFKYAYIVRTLLLTFFFSPFVPIVALFSLLGIFSYYFVCKVLFRYSYKIPNIRSDEINTSALWLTYSAPLSLNLGQFLIFLFINSRVEVSLGLSVEVIVYLSLALSILWTLMPWYEINSRLFKFHQSTNQNYIDNYHNFEVTYEMIDPFYNGEKTLQRDSHFLRTAAKIKRRQTIGAIPHFHTDLQLPNSDRNLVELK